MKTITWVLKKFIKCLGKLFCATCWRKMFTWLNDFCQFHQNPRSYNSLLTVSQWREIDRNNSVSYLFVLTRITSLKASLKELSQGFWKPCDVVFLSKHNIQILCLRFYLLLKSQKRSTNSTYISVSTLIASLCSLWFSVWFQFSVASLSHGHCFETRYATNIHHPFSNQNTN